MMHWRLLMALPLLTILAAPAWAQINAGEKPAEATLPFTITQVAGDLKFPWRLAFLPDGVIRDQFRGRASLARLRFAFDPGTPVASRAAALAVGPAGRSPTPAHSPT